MKNLLYILFSVFFCVSSAFSVNVTSIESLRQRVQGASAELTSSDKAVIADFWSDALGQMFLSKSSREIVEIRRQLEEQKGSESLSYYATAYVAHARSDIQAAFQDLKAEQMDSQQRLMITHNLMVLTAKLKSSQLSPVALQHLGDQDDLMRYWAYKAVTQRAVIEELTSDVTRDDKTVEAILKALEQKVLTEPQPEIRKMVIHFCSAFDHSLARKILLSIAAERISAYKDWTIQDESQDASLLITLGAAAELQSDSDVKASFGRAFAELYALAIQRYMKGGEMLSSDQIDRLKTVIAEVDQTALNKTMGVKTGILPAVRNGRGLDREYETLFGDKMRPGKLAVKYTFDYGKDASGKPVTAPPQLGPAPENLAESD
ncbi:MAG: hypothetical protein ABFR90_06045 [Planctomycetota bacterium]